MSHEENVTWIPCHSDVYGTLLEVVDVLEVVAAIFSPETRPHAVNPDDVVLRHDAAHGVALLLRQAVRTLYECRDALCDAQRARHGD
jgi:hypothetical protein